MSTKSYLKTVSAFANYMNGGVVFGISNGLDTKSIENIDDFCLSIENQINDSIDPKPDYLLQVNSNNTVTLFVNRGINTPYKYKGKAYKRNNTSTIEVDELDLKRLEMVGINQNYEELPSFKQDLSFKLLKEKLIEKINIKSFNDYTLRTLNLYIDGQGYNISAALLADYNDYPGLDIVVYGENINEIKQRATLSG